MDRHASVLIRPSVVKRLVDALQALAGRGSGAVADVERELAKVMPPTSVAESLVIRGLVYEWLMQAGCRRLIAVDRGHYRLTSTGSAFDDLRSVERRARQLVDDQYHLMRGTEDVASRLGSSRSHLSRRFLRAYGVTIANYLRCARVTAAIELLGRSTFKVEAVGELVGFRSKASFYRAVRLATGMTPGALRGRH